GIIVGRRHFEHPFTTDVRIVGHPVEAECRHVVRDMAQAELTGVPTVEADRRELRRGVTLAIEVDPGGDGEAVIGAQVGAGGRDRTGGAVAFHGVVIVVVPERTPLTYSCTSPVAAL